MLRIPHSILLPRSFINALIGNLHKYEVELGNSLKSANTCKVNEKSLFSVLARVDDAMVEHYCNEDTYIINFAQEADGSCSVTLVELATDTIESAEANGLGVASTVLTMSTSH